MRVFNNRELKDNKNDCVICKKMSCSHSNYINDAEILLNTLYSNLININEFISFLINKKIYPSYISFYFYNNKLLTAIALLQKVATINKNEDYTNVLDTLIDYIEEFKIQKKNRTLYFSGNQDDFIRSKTRIKKEFAERVATVISLVSIEDKNIRTQKINKYYNDNYAIFNEAVLLIDLIENYKITNKMNFAFRKALEEFYSDQRILNSYLEKNDAKYIFEIMSYFIGFEPKYSNSRKYGQEIASVFRSYKRNNENMSLEDKEKITKQLCYDLLTKEFY